MSDRGRSSRAQYRRYRDQIRTRPKDEAAGAGHHGHGPGPTNVPTSERKSTKRSRSFFRLFLEFWGLLRDHRRPVLFALFTVTVATIIGLVPLYGTKLIIDNVLGEKPLPKEIPAWLHLPDTPRQLLWVVCIAMIVVALISTVIGNSGRWQATRVGKRVSLSYRRRVFNHAVRLPLHRVYELKSGGVTSILREDAGGVGELVFSMLYNPWRAIVQLTGSLFVLAFVDWRLLIGSLLLIPTVWFTHKMWISRIRPIHKDIRTTRTNIDAAATESFGGMRVVRSFSRQRSESGRYMRASDLQARQELYAWLWMRGIDAAWDLLIPLASALLLWYGGSRVLHDSAAVRAGTLNPTDALTVGDLVMFLGYLAALLGPIVTLASSATALQNNLAGLDRTLDLLEEPIEMPNRPNAVTVDKSTTRGEIRLHNVSFAYPSTRKRSAPNAPIIPSPGTPGEGQGEGPPSEHQHASAVLHDINLHVRAGETVALVGPSGAGKTTLCNLVARFYDVTSGSITLDGTDLRDIDVDSYRRLLGIVEQDTFLFDGTIAENISYGRRGATQSQIEEAARQANAHEFISRLEHGYATLIGERGVKLSGGQRQRLTIARAILADPKILILDEATSNLDTESERLIQTSLRALMQNRTCFVIAHRLSTVAGADRIVVIEGGRIAEQGTHDQLMSRSGRYQQMVLLQTQPMDPRPAAHDAEEPAPIT